MSAIKRPMKNMIARMLAIAPSPAISLKPIVSLILVIDTLIRTIDINDPKRKPVLFVRICFHQDFP